MKSKEVLPAVYESLEKHYEHNTTIRSLLQLIPFGIGSAVDTALSLKIYNLRESRLRAFFDELLNQNITLTEEKYRNNDFIHAFFATMKTVINTRRQEKIRLFAHCFHKYSTDDSFEDPDYYEEVLSILDDMSYLEFQVLLIIDEFESNNPKKKKQNVIQWMDTYWDKMINEIEKLIPTNEIPGFLTRLNRTGLYITIAGAYWGYGGDKGHLTPNFKRFINILKEK